MRNRKLVVLLMMAMLATALTTTAASADGRFDDDDGNVHEANIEWLAAQGITQGCNPPTNDQYCPNQNVTRAQMATFLVRAMGYTDAGAGNLFTDDDGNVHESNIDKLGTAGVTAGCNPPTNDQYCPDTYVTRAQMATFLVRAMGYTDAGAGNLFTDDDGNVHESNIDKLGTAGVTAGCNPPTNDQYCPNDYVTRAQMATFLYRALDGTVPPPPPPGDWEAEVALAITAAGRIPVPGAEKHEESTEEGVDDHYEWVLEKHDVVENAQELVNLGVNDDILWPGNLVRGDTAYDFLYTPIVSYRAPITLWADLESVSCAGEITQVIADPKTSTVKDGIRQLLQKAREDCTTIPARAVFEYEEISTKDQIDVFANADVSRGPVDVAAQFDWSSTTETNKIVAKYQQIYFNIYVDQYVSPSEVFDESRMTSSQVAAAIPPGSQPLMVSRVAYGFQAFTTIQSSFSADSLEFALQASYDDSVTAVDVETGYSAEHIMENSTIKTVVYGGSTAGLNQIYNGLAGFQEVIAASVDAGLDSPGVPLVYQFRNLNDQTNALITQTAQYSFKRQWPLRPIIRVTLDHVKMSDSIQDYGTAGSDDIEMNIARVTVTPYNSTGDGSYAQAGLGYIGTTALAA